MSAEVFMAALFALLIQGLVIYAAIRFALRDDRSAKARDELKAKAAAEWKAKANAEWKASHAAKAALVATEAKQQ